MNYTMHIFGLILFAVIVSSSPIGQNMPITQKPVHIVLASEVFYSDYDLNLTTISEISTLKDENNYQDCICTPFHKCKTYKSASDGNKIINIRKNAAPCQSYFDICCNDTKNTSTEKYKHSCPGTTDNDCGCDKSDDYSTELIIYYNKFTNKSSNGHKAEYYTENQYVVHDVEYFKKQFASSEVDHKQQIYVTHNVNDTDIPSDDNKGVHTKEPYVTHNVEDSEKPSDSSEEDHKQHIYVTHNVNDTDIPSDSSEVDHKQHIYVTHNLNDTDIPFDDHKGVHTKEPYVTHNVEDSKKPSDSSDVDHQQHIYITHNVNDTDIPSDDHKGVHTKQPYVTFNEEETKKIFDNHKGDHTKQPSVTHNVKDIEIPSDSHKGVHTKEPYVTFNEEETKKIFDGHKKEHTQQTTTTYNAEDTQVTDEVVGPSSFTDYEEDNEDTDEFSEDPYVTYNEEETKKIFDSHKGEHTKQPYVTHNVNDTEKLSGRHKRDLSKEPYVTHNINDTEKPFNGHKGNHTKKSDYSYEGIEDLITHEHNISTTEPDKPSFDLQELHKCGVWNKYGVGFRICNAKDSESQFAEFPSMVAIFKEKLSKDGEKMLVLICGGSLIKKDVILTTAYCSREDDISNLVIRAGEWDLKTEKEILNHQDRRVTKIVTHPDYSGRAFHDLNDVALIFTEHPFSLQENIQLICLPSKNDIILKDKCYSSGWRDSVSFNDYTFVKKTESGTIIETGEYQVSILKKVELPIIPGDKCMRSLHDNFICVGGQEGKNPCYGDRGSPLMCPYKDDPERLVQVGIVPVYCGTGRSPAAYVNVAPFVHWINHEIENTGY